MARIIVSENLTLDGVVQDPTGEQGSRRGGWFAEVSESDSAAWAASAFEEAQGAGALLMGRRTYEFFASRWPSRTGAFADRLNSLPKYIVSSTLQDPDWSNSSPLSADGISALKERLDGDIVVYASCQLVRLPIQRKLVDEMRLTVFPFVLGEGERLFDGIGAKLTLDLRDAKPIGDRLALLTYQPHSAAAPEPM